MAAIEKRTGEKGETCYRVKVRLRGFPAQTATFRRLTDARKWATQTEAAIRERRFFKTAEAQKHTLGDLVDRYIRDVLPNKGTQRKTQKTQLEYWKGELGVYMEPGRCRPGLLVDPEAVRYRPGLLVDLEPSRCRPGLPDKFRVTQHWGYPQTLSNISNIA